VWWSRAPGQELHRAALRHPRSWRTSGRAADPAGLLAGLEAVEGEDGIAFVAATDVPFLHPRFVAAVCRAAARGGVDAAVPHLDGHRQPLLAAYTDRADSRSWPSSSPRTG
jgi:molybdopterin-guanine dinucleotide biosynthesis protein A